MVKQRTLEIVCNSSSLSPIIVQLSQQQMAAATNGMVLRNGKIKSLESTQGSGLVLRAPQSNDERSQRFDERALNLLTSCGTCQVIFSINHDQFTKFHPFSEFVYPWNHARASFEVSPARVVDSAI